MEAKKKKQKIQRVTKPYMQGDSLDRITLPGALKFFFATLAMTLIFVISGLIVSWDSRFLTILLNGGILVAAYMIFWQSGANAGAYAVNQGEIMYQRQEKGRPVAEWERSMCFHPAKGFIAALLGTIPLFLASLVLAFIAQRQMTGIGALPSWISTLEARPEIGAPLAYYHEEASLTLEATLRLIVRMSAMPYVNIVGAANRDGLLILERVCPLLSLLPAVSYGVGYLGGIRIRSDVHTNIALGKKKQKQKQRKERRARQQPTRKGPEQLN